MTATEWKITVQGKLYRLSYLSVADSAVPGQPLIERWTCASRRTGRHHWVQIWPPAPNGSMQMRSTAERVIAALNAHRAKKEAS